ncbi:MAG: 50S ribosomal protein L4 [Candidatus Margulisbacteria bacterium]|nr:50S ribosomal protein L4 [Candidatus Margulisiibacteriota bacterium]
MTRTIHVYNLKGEKLQDSLQFSSLPKKIKGSLLHQMAVDYLAKKRSGSANTKTRSEVSGGGRKPWAQKGTGRARAGSTRSPLFRGGGVIFGPKPRKYGGIYTKQFKKAALRSALLNKSKTWFVLKEIEAKHGKTKEVVELLKHFKVKSALFVDEKISDLFLRATRNIKEVKAISLNSVNVYDLLKYEAFFISLKAGKKLAEVLG